MRRNLCVLGIVGFVGQIFTVQGAMAADYGPTPQRPAATAGTVPQDYADTTTTALLKTASENGSFILQAAQLAAQKSRNADVKQFAEILIRSNVNGYGDIGRATSGDAGDPKRSPMALRPEQLTLLNGLKSAPATEFDMLFVDGAVTALRDNLTVLQKYATGGTNPNLKEIAAQGVTSHTANLTAAESLQARLHKKT